MAEKNNALCCEQDAKRYRWLRSKLVNGNETYIGEWITSENELDEYIDKKMALESPML